MNLSASRPTRTARIYAAFLVSILLTAGCDSPEPVSVPPEVTRLINELKLIEGPMNAALNGVWQSPDGQWWFAGGGSGGASALVELAGGLVARLEGDLIRPMEVPAGPLLWWIAGVDSTRVWACGDQGRILRFDGEQWDSEFTGLDEKAVLWGLWARNATDIWAVGGSYRRGGPKGVVLHSAGDGVWERIDDPALPADMNLYKVWGDDEQLIIVGEGGVAIRLRDGVFSRIDVGVSDLLFTVDGRPAGPVLAVGGLESGLIFRQSESGWFDESIPGTAPLNGVAVNTAGQAVAVGARGTLLFRDAPGRWYPVPLEARDAIRDRTLHAARWSDELWVVGGNLTTLTNGVVLTNRQPVPRWEVP